MCKPNYAFTHTHTHPQLSTAQKATYKRSVTHQAVKSPRYVCVETSHREGNWDVRSQVRRRSSTFVSLHFSSLPPPYFPLPPPLTFVSIIYFVCLFWLGRLSGTSWDWWWFVFQTKEIELNDLIFIFFPCLFWNVWSEGMLVFFFSVLPFSSIILFLSLSPIFISLTSFPLFLPPLAIPRIHKTW